MCFLLSYLEGIKKIKKHLNQNKQTLERSLNLTSQSAKQVSHPLQGDDRWFVKWLSKFGLSFWTTNIPLLLSQTHFFGVVFPTIWKVLLGTCVSLISSPCPLMEAGVTPGNCSSQVFWTTQLFASHIGNIDSMRHKSWFPPIK